MVDTINHTTNTRPHLPVLNGQGKNTNFAKLSVASLCCCIMRTYPKPASCHKYL
jgi:hypothetical protein